jgi:hypothetical protein
MIKGKKGSKIVIAVAGAVMGTLAVVAGVFGLIPRMREKCIKICEKMKEKGIKPPAFCNKIMGKCCGECSEEKED